jgi:hypothetical protein
MTPLETALSGAVTTLVGAITWLTLKLIATMKDRDALHEAHKQELRENGKTMNAFVERLFQAIDRLNDLAAHRPP